MLGRQWRCVLIATVAVAVVTFLSGIPQSFAHPVYVDSTPRAFQSVQSSPEEISVIFSEPIELPYSSIKVLGPDGSRVDKNDPRNLEGDTASIATSLQPNLPEGVYTVEARVLSAVDGHVVTEAFNFGVGVAASGQGTTGQQQRDILSPEESASRFPGMVGQVIAVGAAFGTLWLWKPLGRVPWLSSAISQTRVAIDRRMIKLIIIGAGLVLASGVAMIIVQAISIEAGVPEAIATKFGNVWITRMFQSSILMAIAVAVYRKVSKSNTSPSRVEMFAILIMGLAVLLTSSLIAHAAATEQIAPIVLDFFHNAAASIWIGGLILLGFAAVPKLLAIADERVRSTALAILIPRFSVIVVTILGIAVITGPILLFSLESDLSLTLASTYGQILAIKLSLAGVMVAMGAYSQFVVQRKAVAVMNNNNGGSTQVAAATSLRNYGKTLKAEAGVGIVLLLMVSLMANGALPSGQFQAYQRQAAADQQAFAEEINTDLVRTAYTGEGRVQLAISPFAVGQNNFKVSFFEQDGSNATGIESATIKMTQLERGIGPITVETRKQSENVFVADAAFSLPGVWSVEIEGVSSQGSNMLASLDLNVKPLVSNLEFATKEYRTPENSLPLYPVFDAERQSIWVGDTLPRSGRIWQLDIETGNYTMHRIEGASLITQMVLAPGGSLWYIDPVAASPNGVLGHYDPASNTTRRFTIPEGGVPSGIAMDGSGNLWIPVVQANKIVKFDVAGEQFTAYDIPTTGSTPVGISVDRQGNVWFAEAAGMIGRIDPATGNITEYEPPSERNALDEPTAVFPDPRSSIIYISEHGGHTITAFNPMLGTFREYPSVNEGGLPFGMAMDSYGNLWYAQHEIDSVAVIDPRTGAGAEAKVPITGSFIQWITADDKGRIWFAAQRGEALGSIAVTAKPSAPPVEEEEEEEQGSGGPVRVAQQLGFSFADLAGPAIAAGIALSALAYGKSAIDLKRNMRTALKLRT
jgi:copper transport protein